MTEQLLLGPLAFGVVLLAAWSIAEASTFYKVNLADKGERVLPLDGLRGFLATSVFIHHAYLASAYARTGVWGGESRWVMFLGQGAVCLFFMITGYLFWTKALSSRGSLAPVRLWTGRVRRLAPLYLFSAVLLLVIALPHFAGATLIQSSAFVGRLTMLGIFGWVDLPGFTHGFVNAGVEWSLWYEWRFYLLLPFVALGLRFKAWLPLFLCASFFSIAVVLRWPIDRHWIAFFPGMLAAHLIKYPKVTHFFQSNTVAFLTMLGAAAGLSLTQSYLRDLASVTPLFIAVASGNTIFGVLIRPTARLLGTISYSLYLLHGFVLLGIVGPWIFGADKQGVPARIYIPLVLLAAFLTVLLCCLTYRWIEHPFLSSSRRAQPRPQLASIGQGESESRELIQH